MKKPLRTKKRHSVCNRDFLRTTLKILFHKKYQMGESVIPKKYREMMMLASAVRI